MSIFGITPDLTLYSATTKRLINQWSNVLSSIEEDWEVEYDVLGEVVDATPIWHIEFKDGSKLSLTTETEPAKATPGVFDCRHINEKDTKALINAHVNVLKHVNRNFKFAYGSTGEVDAILPCRRFEFKTGQDIASSIILQAAKVEARGK